MKNITLGKLLTIALLLLVCSIGYAQNTEQLLKDWTRAKEYTKEYLEIMPEDGYGFKPTPEMRTFAEQMLHFTDANMELASLIGSTKNPIGRGAASKLAIKSKAATMKLVLDGYDFVISVIKQMSQTDYQQNVNAWDKYTMTKALLLNKMFEHQTHHRGQTTVYIRLKGITPPTEKLF